MIRRGEKKLKQHDPYTTFKNESSYFIVSLKIQALQKFKTLNGKKWAIIKLIIIVNNNNLVSTAKVELEP